MSNTVFIIAEAGVNHNGDMALAKRLVEAAAAAGADAVKFQSFVAENLVTRSARQAAYQVANTGAEEGQYAMLKRLELTPEQHRVLKSHCANVGVRFMSTAFDDDSIDLLKSIGSLPWKIPSGEITNLPYLRRVGSFNEETILSTGMAELHEVIQAVDVLEAAGTHRSKISLLHCTTDYPAPFGDVNLRAMATMQQALNLRVGYSDHTEGIEVACAAVALGANIIEKHFTVDRNLPGPDHKASLEPRDFEILVRSIRNLETALGDGVKRPSASELRNRSCARKSIVAARPIRTGEIFTEDNLTTKRPGTGLSPMRWHAVIGMRADREYEVDAAIQSTGESRS